MINDTQFLESILTFIKKHKIAKSTFGLNVVNDGKFVGRLEQGGSVTLRMANKIFNYMEKYDE
jgi:hypothetical protein